MHRYFQYQLIQPFLTDFPVSYLYKSRFNLHEGNIEVYFSSSFDIASSYLKIQFIDEFKREVFMNSVISTTIVALSQEGRTCSNHRAGDFGIIITSPINIMQFTIMKY